MVQIDYTIWLEHFCGWVNRSTSHEMRVVTTLDLRKFLFELSLKFITRFFTYGLELIVLTWCWLGVSHHTMSWGEFITCLGCIHWQFKLSSESFPHPVHFGSN